MAFEDFQTLIRLSKWRLDELRRILQELQDQEDTLRRLLRELAEQVIVEMNASADQPHEGGLMFAAYYRVAQERAEALENAIVEVQLRIEVARDNVAEGYKELKTYEIAEENRVEALRQERARQEQITTDEQAITQFLRAEKSDS